MHTGGNGAFISIFSSSKETRNCHPEQGFLPIRIDLITVEFKPRAVEIPLKTTNSKMNFFGQIWSTTSKAPGEMFKSSQLMANIAGLISSSRHHFLMSEWAVVLSKDLLPEKATLDVLVCCNSKVNDYQLKQKL